MGFKDLCFYALTVLGVADWSEYIMCTFLLMMHLLEVWKEKVPNPNSTSQTVEITSS